MKFRSFEKFKEEMLKDPIVKAEYDRLGPEYKLIAQVIAERIKKGLTQAQLAKVAGTRQSAISRLESGGYNPSLNFMQKIATALGTKLEVNLI